jgi:hypothetical protein
MVPEKSSAQVSTLTEFFKGCVELMRDIISLSILYKMIDHCKKGRGTPVTQRMVNQVFVGREPMGNSSLMHKLGNTMWIILS